jgi:ethanolamine ammonia-lyase small subunit
MADDIEIERSTAFSADDSALRAYTPARVALDRAGSSMATRPALEFALAHAQARDAVYSELDLGTIVEALAERGISAVAAASAAEGRAQYLRRPDLGRRLSAASATALGLLEAARLKAATDNRQPATSLSVILADGLSALATQRHAIPLLDALLALLDESWTLTPIVVAEQARVALGDEVGTLLQADVSVMLIGERPGLSSPDSLGAYITWSPRVGRTDAERNCVSNIRVGGLDYANAAQKIAWYVSEGRRLGLSGVAVREADAGLLP